MKTINNLEESMTKIFISHSTADKEVVTKLMDLLQTQFNLTRSNFFCTSDEELDVGGNWIEQIRMEMKDATLILPIITPHYLESHFCMCELGAAWVNQQALIPLIIPPLNHNALGSTPYRSWIQSITLESVADCIRLGDVINSKNIGQNVNMVRFNSRATEFYEEYVLPFIKKMERRITITPEHVKNMEQKLIEFKHAYDLVEKEVSELKSENQMLRKMKNSEEIKKMDYEKMDEWEEFLSAKENVRKELDKLDSLVVSIFFNNQYKKGYSSNFVGADESRQRLKVLEAEGYIYWEDGWVLDDEDPTVSSAQKALEDLNAFMNANGDIIEARFFEEFQGTRFGLNFSPFWENVLMQNIWHSSE